MTDSKYIGSLRAINYLHRVSQIGIILTSQAQTSNNVQSRQKSRLFIVFAFAMLLACVPVLPLKFLGIPGPDGDLNLASIANLPTWISNKFKPHEGKTKHQAASAQQGKPATEIELLDQAAKQLTLEISKSPSDPALYNRLGLIYAGLGELDAAEAQFQKAVELGRQKLATESATLKSQLAQNQRQEASETLIEQSSINVELAASHSNLARIYEKLGEQDKVVHELNQLNALTTVADQVNIQTKLTAGMNAATARLFANAQTLMASGFLPEAIKKYQQAAIASPQLAIIHQQLGLAYLLVQNHAEAARELERAASLDPKNADIHNNLGLAYQAQGYTGKARHEFETALKIKPKLATAALNLGNINSANGNFPAAETAYRRAIAADARSAVAHNNLAAIYSMEGRYSKTIEEFQKAIAIEPKMASAHYGLGLAYYNSGKYIASIPEFRQAAALNPSLSDAQAKIDAAVRKSGQY